MCEFCKASSHCQGHWLLVACLSAAACECVRQSQKTKKKKQRQRKKEGMVGERSTDGHGFLVLPNWSSQALAHTLCSCLVARPKLEIWGRMQLNSISRQSGAYACRRLVVVVSQFPLLVCSSTLPPAIGLKDCCPTPPAAGLDWTGLDWAGLGWGLNEVSKLGVCLFVCVVVLFRLPTRRICRIVVSVTAAGGRLACCGASLTHASAPPSRINSWDLPQLMIPRKKDG